MGATQNITASEIEAVLLTLNDITSACVVTDKIGNIDEIHILSTTARPPKQMVRDIESALMAKFGIELDHKKVSIAKTQTDRQFKISNKRLKFTEVSISLNGTKGEATVSLRKNDETFTGTASGHCSHQNQLRLIASATLNAVGESVGDGTDIILEDIGTITLADKSVIVVYVNFISPHGEDILTGSAIVKQDTWKAVVNAALDAINRRISIIDED
jgi:hypothetical protein